MDNILKFKDKFAPGDEPIVELAVGQHDQVWMWQYEQYVVMKFSHVELLNDAVPLPTKKNE